MKKSIHRTLIMCVFFIPSFFGSQLFADMEQDKSSLTFHVLLSKKSCQLAIWIIDKKGKFVDTVYVTRKTAKKGLGNRGGELDDHMGGSRFSVLPVWAYQRGVDYGGGNVYPPKDSPLVDAVTSATPKAGEFVWTWHPAKKLTPGTYTYYIEVNKSFDDNEYHNYSWYRGQPSVVWQGKITVGEQTSKSEAKIIGHGDTAGKNGKISSDLSTLTTALHLIKKAGAVYMPGKP